MITFWILVVIIVLFIVLLATLFILAIVQGVYHIVQWTRDKIHKAD